MNHTRSAWLSLGAETGFTVCTAAFALFLNCPVTEFVPSLLFPVQAIICRSADPFLRPRSSLHSRQLSNPILMQSVNPFLNVVLPLVPVEFHLIFSV